MIFIAKSLKKTHLICEILLINYLIYNNIKYNTFEISFNFWIFNELTNKIMIYINALFIFSIFEICNHFNQFLKLIKKKIFMLAILLFSLRMKWNLRTLKKWQKCLIKINNEVKIRRSIKSKILKIAKVIIMRTSKRHERNVLRKKSRKKSRKL